MERKIVKETDIRELLEVVSDWVPVCQVIMGWRGEYGIYKRIKKDILKKEYRDARVILYEEKDGKYIEVLSFGKPVLRIFDRGIWRYLSDDRKNNSTLF